MGSGWETVKRKLQCPKDDDAAYENTTWCNRDLIPIPPDRRTYGVLSYLGYWTVAGSCLSAWSTGSTLLAFGLSPRQAIGAVVGGGVVTGLLAVACGWMGENHHIGFTVSSRFSWGMRGSYFPVILRIFTGSIWFGLQALWGGQATRVAIGALFPRFAHLPNRFDPRTHLQTNDFIGLVVWLCLFVPGVLVKPEELQPAFVISFIFFCGSCFGLLIWALSLLHGPGEMFYEPGTTENASWDFLFGITAILGAWGGGTIGQSDWTRYASRKYAPLMSQMVASPVTISATAIIGIIVTSAARDIIQGEILWNPIHLLAAIQDYYESSIPARIAVFLASLGLIGSQLLVSIVMISISTGMDIAGLWPKYLNIVRGGYIMAVVGIATQPWHILATATKFLAVISGFGIFLAPATGIMLADYHLVRRRRLKLKDLYVGNGTSIYWFDHGFNWRALAAFIAGAWPLVPGLVATVNGYTSPSWVPWIRLYNLTFVVGLAIGSFVFWLLNLVFPVPGIGQDAPFLDESLDAAPDTRSAPEHQVEAQGMVKRVMSTFRCQREA
ncbi:hypothetical protein G6O67_000176 [Ophiocordyceps sinensis]|uniref:Uncharacterized protein n=1 Tax=Ophiocordyceps sinensis TaxID=72228 RepID=A0A8H4V9G7_9HYPO|nr:hypothetical protein G6O67_000176 [Ophiocordyceps sinensis]